MRYSGMLYNISVIMLTYFILSRFRVVTTRRGMDWMIGFIDTLVQSTRTYKQYSVIADLHNLHFTVANTNVLSLLQSPLVVSWQRILTQEQSHYITHIQTSLHCRTFSSQPNSLDSSITCQLPTPEISIQFSAATANSRDTLNSQF
jgi:hypothetical protein